jgi:trk system potassium uptake protein TrkH
MKIAYRDNTLERVLIGAAVAVSFIIVASFAFLFGFYRPPIPIPVLLGIQTATFLVYLAIKVVRLLNAESKREYLIANWYEIPMLVALAVVLFGSGRWFGLTYPSWVRHMAIAIYLIVNVATRAFTVLVSLAATGRNPAKTLVASFAVLILTGTALLALPRATRTSTPLGFTDALFTATSATCVTGLVVKDTGTDFTLMGQLVILTLIQLGGLGIVIFGAVLALLLGQSLGVRESVAMQDLLSAGTLGRINRMILFIFIATALIEFAGAAALLPMWDRVGGQHMGIHHRWYYSVFHAVSAFCNAGFGLFNDSLVRYNRCWGVYLVICPLIILGGLGFGVLYDLGLVLRDRVLRACQRFLRRPRPVFLQAPKRMWLQTKIVLCVSVSLIVGGMLALWVFERLTGDTHFGVREALFQSVTARTAGFSTVDIGVLSDASKLILILLMFIGGSPGGTAGGIKTVTLAVVVMAIVATLRRREEVQLFHRSVRLMLVRRAMTVIVLLAIALFATTLGLCITETSNDFTTMQMAFEAASALGTVGLSSGITPALTTAGKLIIIVAMLVGRLGPLTLLASMTFNLKLARYSYPDEAIVVG